jgi:2-phosphosulfolactate phosphatase
VERYRADHALVAVDVYRATTVMVTALAVGRAVFPVPTLADALASAARMPDALLAGEQAGVVPPGFKLDNSPALLERLPGREPLVLLTSAGTRLLDACRGAQAVYVACLRNLSATAEQVASVEERVALVGAGTAGRSRPEDQLVCAWIGRQLLRRGFAVENEATLREVEAYGDADLDVVLCGSPSASWLRDNGRGRDVDFVLDHVDDIGCAARYDGARVELWAGSRDAARLTA